MLINHGIDLEQVYTEASVIGAFALFLAGDFTVENSKLGFATGEVKPVHVRTSELYLFPTCYTTKSANNEVGVIRVCGTAEFEENMSRNTEF